MQESNERTETTKNPETISLINREFSPRILSPTLPPSLHLPSPSTYPPTNDQRKQPGVRAAVSGEVRDGRGYEPTSAGGICEGAGKEHPDTLTSVYYLAFILHQQQPYEAASALHKGQAADANVYSVQGVLLQLHVQTTVCL
jgi:hypothetical protein